jgi:hypothetical protein
LAAFQEASEFRGWVLLAAHVRETHVHLVIHGLEPPEKMMVDLKLYASRKLNEARVDSHRPQALGTPWKYALPVEARNRRGRNTLCDPRARRADGDI